MLHADLASTTLLQEALRAHHKKIAISVRDPWLSVILHKDTYLVSEEQELLKMFWEVSRIEQIFKPYSYLELLYFLSVCTEVTVVTQRAN